jgi:hypothetical protein
MTLKTPEMTGTKSKFWSKFRFRLDSVPATGRNFSGILNLAVNLTAARAIQTSPAHINRLGIAGDAIEKAKW